MKKLFSVTLVAGACGLSACGPDDPGIPKDGFNSGGGAGKGGGGSGAGKAGGSGMSGSAGSAGTSSAGSSGMSGSAGSAGTSSAGSAGTSSTGGSAGTTSSGGTAGTAGAPPDGGGAGSTAKPPCLAKSSQVVIIGDSYITGFLTPPLQPELENLARAAGALAVGSAYRNYAVAGTAMATGGLLGLIPPQFDTALAWDKDIQTIIMSGGGNDVLLGPEPRCKETGSSQLQACTDIVSKAVTAAETLMAKMAASGVKDIVYYFYPNIPSMPGGLGGGNGNEILSYAYPFARAGCEGASVKSGGKVNCHFIDLRPVFQGHPDYIAGDGVHPSATGMPVIAGQVWQTMKQNCLAQPASSGCCAP